MSAPALTELLGKLTDGAALREGAVLMALCLCGALFLLITGLRRSVVWLGALSFPVGLSLFSLSGFFCLLTGLPFTGLSVPLVVLFFVACLLLFRVRKNRKTKNRPDFDADLFRKGIPVLAALFLVAVLFSVFRFLPVLVDNDSVYYYSVFPETLVREGRYIPSFDTFLTDVGPLSAVLNCLPFFYGFDDTIAVQTMMNLSFLVSFALLIRREALLAGAGKREARIALVFALAFLLGSMPFWFVSLWVMSNAYFMELFFIAALLGYRSLPGSGEEEPGFFAALLLFISMCSALRVEGSVMTALLVASFSLGRDNSKIRLVTETLAAALPQLLFFATLYIRLGVDPLYSFLDLKKAALTLGMFIFLALWILLIRDRIMEKEMLFSLLPAALISVLLLGNLGLCGIDSERYISNLRTFILNIRLGNGWGIFGIFFALCVLAVAFDLIRVHLCSPDFFDFFFPALLLTIVAVCWARGGLLRVGVGDSGNRVLMQTVPFTVMILVRKAGRCFGAAGEDSRDHKIQ